MNFIPFLKNFSFTLEARIQCHNKGVKSRFSFMLHCVPHWGHRPWLNFPFRFSVIFACCKNPTQCKTSLTMWMAWHWVKLCASTFTILSDFKCRFDIFKSLRVDMNTWDPAFCLLCMNNRESEKDTACKVGWTMAMTCKKCEKETKISHLLKIHNTDCALLCRSLYTHNFATKLQYIDHCRIEDHNFATSIAVALRSAMSAGNILALRAKIVILVAMSTDFVPKFSVWMWWNW